MPEDTDDIARIESLILEAPSDDIADIEGRILGDGAGPTPAKKPAFAASLAKTMGRAVTAPLEAGASASGAGMQTAKEAIALGPALPIAVDLAVKMGLDIGRQARGPEERAIRNVAAGAAGTVSGFGGAARALGFEEIGKAVTGLSERVSRSVAPPDPKFIDQVAQGFGSSAVFLVPGFGVQAGAAGLARFAPRMAAWLGAGTAAVLEASVEAGGVYNEATSRGIPREEALKAANQNFWGNIGVITLTNRLGLFSENAKALRGVASSLLEGTQEAAQTVMQNFALHDPALRGTLESFGVGAIVGGGTALATQRAAAKPAQEAPAQTAAQVEGAGGPQTIAPPTVSPGLVKGVEGMVAGTPGTEAAASKVRQALGLAEDIGLTPEAVGQALDQGIVSVQEIEALAAPGLPQEAAPAAPKAKDRGLDIYGQPLDTEEPFGPGSWESEMGGEYDVETMFPEVAAQEAGLAAIPGLAVESLPPSAPANDYEDLIRARLPEDMRQDFDEYMADRDPRGRTDESVYTRDEFLGILKDFGDWVAQGKQMALPEAEAQKALEATPETPAPAPAPQLASEEFTREEFESVRQAVESGQVEIPAGSPFHAVDAFFKFNPDAIGVVVDEQGNLTPRLAPKEAFLEPVTEGPASMSPDEFQARFPNLTPDIHRESVKKVIEAGQNPEPAAADAYPDLEREMRAKEAEQSAGSKTPVLDAIRRGGGISRESYEANRGEMENARARNIIRKKGKSISKWAEILAERGVLKSYDEGELLRIMDAESRGIPTPLVLRDQAMVAESAPGTPVRYPKKLYRGIVRGNQESGSIGMGTFTLGKGLYTTPSKSYAKLYSKEVVEVDPSVAYPKNPLVLDARGKGGAASVFMDWLLSKSGEKNAREFNKRFSDPGVFVRSLGYDGVVIGDEVVKYDAPQIIGEASIAMGAPDVLSASQVLDKAASDIEQLQFDFDAEGSTVPDSLRRDGFVDFRGTKVENIKQLGEVVAAFRHPKLENFQAVFVKDGVVVAHQVVSSGLPDGVILGNRHAHRIRATADRLGADSVYLAHNHPSGDPEPSFQDLGMTKLWAKLVGPKMKGHLVTDDTHFSLISEQGIGMGRIAFEKPKASFREKGVLKVTQPSQAAAVAAKAMAKGDSLAVVFLEAKQRVLAVESVRTDANIQKFMAERGRFHGATGMALVHPPGWKPVLPGKFPNRTLDIIEASKDGKVIRSMTNRNSVLGNQATLVDPESDIAKMMVRGTPFYGVQEGGVQYTPDEFQAFAMTAGIRPGMTLTLREAIESPTLKGGRLPKGRKVVVLDYDRQGVGIAVQPEGALPGGLEFAIADPNKFVETYREQKKDPKPSATKKAIEQATGLKPAAQDAVSMTQIQALKLKFRSMERGSAWGATQARKEERGALLAELRKSDSDKADIRKRLLTRIKVMSEIPASKRGPLTRMVMDAKTGLDLARGLSRIDAAAAEARKAVLVSDIKVMASRAMESPSVAVEYKRRIRDLLSGIDLTRRNASTLAKLKATREWLDRQKALGNDVQVPEEVVDRLSILARRPVAEVSEVQLAQIVDDLNALTLLGKTMVRARRGIREMVAERVKKEVVAGVVAIEKTVKQERIPGQPELPLTVRLSNQMKRLSDWLQYSDLTLMPMDVLFDILDGNKGYSGALHRNFKQRMDAAWARYKDTRDAAVVPVEEMAVRLKLGKQEFERIGIHAMRAQEGGLDHLLALGLTPEYIKSVRLTPQETELYRAMRSAMDGLFPRVQQTMADLYNEDVEKVADYFPFQTDWDTLSDMQVFERLGEAMGNLGRRRKQVERGFTKSRVGGKQGVKVDAMEIFIRHMDDAAYLAEAQADILMLSDIARSPEFAEAAGEVGHLVVLQWMDVLARKGGAEGAKRIAILDQLRRNIGAATLGFKLSSVLIQPTSLFDGAMLLGKDTFGGAAEILHSREIREFLYQHMPELRARIGDDPAYVELTPWFTALESAQRKGFEFLQIADRLSASAVAWTAYKAAVEKKGGAVDLTKPDPEALQFANLMLRRTQASPLFKDLSLAISRGDFIGNRSFAKALLQFKTFVVNRWSLVRHDIYTLGWKGGNKEQAVWGAVYLMLAALAETGIRRGANASVAGLLSGLGFGVMPPEDKDKFAVDAVKQLLDMVPFVSDVVRWGQYDSVPVPVISTAEKAVGGGARAIKSQSAAAKVRGAVRAIEGLAGLAGIPGATQAGQILQAILRDRKLLFPFAGELKDLRDERKRGGLTAAERERLAVLERADGRFGAYRDRFKRAIEKGDYDEMRKAAEEAKDEMKRYR